jgi:hypothetical protein
MRFGPIVRMLAARAVQKEEAWLNHARYCRAARLVCWSHIRNAGSAMFCHCVRFPAPGMAPNARLVE